jgi:hypothetical protein
MPVFAARLGQIEQAYQHGEINDAQRKRLLDEVKAAAKPYEERTIAAANEVDAEVDAFEEQHEGRLVDLETRLTELGRAIGLTNDLNELRRLRDELHALHREEINLERLAGQHDRLREYAAMLRAEPLAYVDALYDNYPSLRKGAPNFGARIERPETGLGFDPSGPSEFIKSNVAPIRSRRR